MTGRGYINEDCPVVKGARLGLNEVICLVNCNGSMDEKYSKGTVLYGTHNIQNTSYRV